MKFQNYNLLMSVAGIDLNETEMEAIVGGVVVTSGGMSVLVKNLAFNYQSNSAGGIKLINDTFSKVVWSNQTEKQRQYQEFNNFLSKNSTLKSQFASLWSQYKNDQSFKSGSGLHFANMVNTLLK